MTIRKHQSIVQHYENCLALHGDSNLGVDWPNKQDAEKRYLVMLKVIREIGDEMTLLDFGCGASHLYPFLKKSPFSSIKYSGLDASENFCSLSMQKYPENDYFCLDVLTEPEKLNEFDCIVMNGVFTEKCDLTFDEMFHYFQQVMRVIFTKARKGLAFNVMSKQVDWERDDLFHVSFDLLANFLTKELSRHFIIRNDYGLYEYTIYLYKEPTSCLMS